MKSPQERRIDELENQVKSYRERTESLQHEWLRLQGHVVKLTEQHHKMVADINLVNKRKKIWVHIIIVSVCINILTIVWK